MRRVLLLVALAACGKGDHARERAPAGAAARPDPRVEAALTETLTAAMAASIAAAAKAGELHHEAEVRAQRERDQVLLEGLDSYDDDDDDDPDPPDDGVAGGVMGGVVGGTLSDPAPALTPRHAPPTITVRAARGTSGFPTDQVAAQTDQWVAAVEACLAGLSPDDFNSGPVHPHRVSVRITWDDDAPAVQSASSLPNLGSCVERRLTPVGGVAAGAIFFAFAHVQ